MNSSRVAGWFATASLGAMTSAPHAQTAEVVPLEEVMVTATRRAAPLQEVPIAVTTISAEQFARSAYKNPTDLQYMAPSVQVSASGGIGFNVRGVGTNSFNAATEQTVGMVVDGVVSGFVDDIGGDLTDVTRIEVLRGPQGTQFGKNASAGVINVTTERPNMREFAPVVHVAYGDYNDTNASIRTNIPIADTLAGSLSVSYQNRDGWAYNPVKGKDEGDSDQIGAKAKLLWEPSDKVSAYFIADYRDSHISPNFLSTYRSLGIGAGLVPPGFGILDYGIVPGPENTQTGISSNSFRDTEQEGASLEVNYHLGDYTLTSLTAYRHREQEAYATLGGTPIVYVEGPSRGFADQFSQELRITSPAGERAEYVAGLYYYRRASRQTGLLAGPFGGLAELLHGPGAKIAFSGGEDHSNYSVESIAAFADGSVSLTDKLSLLVGGRYTYDDASAGLYTVPVPNVYPLGPNANGPGASQVDNTDFSYRAGLKYKLNADMMAYATFARGYKGPLAIAVAGSGARVVKEETVNAYEVGLKSSWLGDSLLVNVALFHEKFKDFQTSVLDTSLVPPGFVLGNAGGLKSQGVELEVAVRPIERLSLGVNVAYQDATFTDFLTSCYSNFEPVPMPTTTDPAAVGACYRIPGTTTSYTQAKGSPIPNASEWNTTANASYNWTVGGSWQADAALNYLYRTEFYTNGADPNTRIPGYGIVNLNVGLGSQEGSWRVGVYARNLFDEYYISAIETGIFDTGGLVNVLNPEAQRTVGVSLDVRF